MRRSLIPKMNFITSDTRVIDVSKVCGKIMDVIDTQLCVITGNISESVKFHPLVNTN